MRLQNLRSVDLRNNWDSTKRKPISGSPNTKLSTINTINLCSPWITKIGLMVRWLALRISRSRRSSAQQAEDCQSNHSNGRRICLIYFQGKFSRRDYKKSIVGHSFNRKPKKSFNCKQSIQLFAFLIPLWQHKPTSNTLQIGRPEWNRTKLTFSQSTRSKNTIHSNKTGPSGKSHLELQENNRVKVSTWSKGILSCRKSKTSDSTLKSTIYGSEQLTTTSNKNKQTSSK